jgi:hypothetical protein
LRGWDIYRNVFVNLQSAELYDPVTNSWTELAHLRTRVSATATLLPNGKVLVAGGRNEFGLAVSAGIVRRVIAVLSAGGSQYATSSNVDAAAKGKVLVAGGVDPPSSPPTNAELYDPVTDT